MVTRIILFDLTIVVAVHNETVSLIYSWPSIAHNIHKYSHLIATWTGAGGGEYQNPVSCARPPTLLTHPLSLLLNSSIHFVVNTAQ